MDSPVLVGESRSTPISTPLASVSAAGITARLDRLPASRTLWKIILLLSLGAFFEYYEIFSTAYVLPGMINSGMLTATTAGFFGMTGAAGYIAATYTGLLIGVLAYSPLAERFGRRPIFTVALLCYSLTAFVTAFQTDALSLNAWRFITGIGIGLELVNIDAYLTELVPVRIRGRAFAINKFISFLAAPVVALLAFVLVPMAPLGFEGWRWVIVIGGCGALLAWFIRLGLPESPRWLANNGQLEKADRVVKALEAKVLKEVGKPLPVPLPAVAEVTFERARFKDLWQGQYRSRTLMLLIFNAGQAIGTYGFTHWMPTLLLEQGLALSESLKIGVMIACVAPFGPLLALGFADRVERKWQIVGSALLVIIAGMSFVAVRSTLLIFATGAVMAIGVAILTLAYHAYQTELYPTRNRGLALSLVYAVSRLFGAGSGFFIAAALKAAGVSGAMLLISGCMLVVMLSIGILGPKTRGRSLEDISH